MNKQSMHSLVVHLWGKARGCTSERPANYDKNEWITLDNLAIQVDELDVLLPPTKVCVYCHGKTTTCEDCCGAGKVCSVCDKPRRAPDRFITEGSQPETFGCDCKIGSSK